MAFTVIILQNPSNPPTHSRGCCSIVFHSTDEQMQNWLNEKLGNIGGSLGGIAAYLLNISLVHLAEIGLYALVGSAVGEGVKFAIEYYKKKKSEG
jgi:hypothetical protein